ncbi:MAG: hypothetical protein II767_13135 [Proteobacteria bacterium]|nr:hypothetical protein [Pseudomonadota bacterium]
MSSPGKHCSFLAGVLVFFCLPALSVAQDPIEKPQIPDDYVVPPPRTITTELKPEKPKRVVDIHFFENRQSCSLTFKAEASRVETHVDQPVTFRTSITKKCGSRALNAPIPVQQTFSVRSTKKKKQNPDAVQKITPNASSSSFLYKFDSPGVWQVTVVNKMDDIETHTLSFPITVLP